MLLLLLELMVAVLDVVIAEFVEDVLLLVELEAVAEVDDMLELALLLVTLAGK